MRTDTPRRAAKASSAMRDARPSLDTGTKLNNMDMATYSTIGADEADKGECPVCGPLGSTCVVEIPFAENPVRGRCRNQPVVGDWARRVES